MSTLPAYHKADHHLTALQPFSISVYRGMRKREAPVPDIHYDFHLGILLAGRARTDYPEHSRENRPGEVWWTSCWEPHTGPILEDGTSLLLITVSPESLGNIDVFGDVSWAAPFLVPPAQRPQPRGRASRKTVLAFAAELEALKGLPARDGRLRIWLKIHELILFLCEDWKPSGASEGANVFNDFARVLPAIECVRSHLGRSVTLDEAAEACGLSRSRFGEVFRAVMGETFGKFARRARLSGAAHALVSSSNPVKAIGFDCGFADNAHFTHAFRRQFGYAPSAFRARASSSLQGATSCRAGSGYRSDQIGEMCLRRRPAAPSGGQSQHRRGDGRRCPPAEAVAELDASRLNAWAPESSTLDEFQYLMAMEGADQTANLITAGHKIPVREVYRRNATRSDTTDPDHCWCSFKSDSR